MFSKNALRSRAAFAYQFNRRFDLAALPERLLIAVIPCRLRSEPHLLLVDNEER